MTAVLVLQLRDEGRLALDDPLYRHLPGTPVGGVTLRQLLGHAPACSASRTASGGNGPPAPTWTRCWPGSPPTKVAYPPYRAYHYSNLAYGLLGAVLERLTGDVLAGPGHRSGCSNRSGMRRTTYHAAEPFARGLRRAPVARHPARGAAHRHRRRWPRPGSSGPRIADLARWAAFLADPATPDGVLAPATPSTRCAPRW